MLPCPTSIDTISPRQKILIGEYESLVRLDNGITKQVRGQRFNKLISDVLTTHGIRSRPNNEGPGEIDVVFEMDAQRYVLEAKWERSPVDEGAICKLRDRVRKRLSGTNGIVLSMSGYTSDCLQDMKQGQELNVVLLTKEHFEAILYGYLAPAELIRRVYDNAHFRGEPLTTLEKLNTSIHADLEMQFDDVDEGIDFVYDKSKYKVIPLFRASNLSDIKEDGKKTFLVSSREGVIKIDTVRKKILLALGVPGSPQFCKIENGWITIRNNCIGKLEDDAWFFERCDLDNEKRHHLLSKCHRYSKGWNNWQEIKNKTVYGVISSIDGQLQHELEGNVHKVIEHHAGFYIRTVSQANFQIYMVSTDGTSSAKRSYPMSQIRDFEVASDNNLVMIKQQSIDSFNLESGEFDEILSCNLQLCNLSNPSDSGMCIFGVFTQHSYAGTAYFKLEGI